MNLLLSLLAHVLTIGKVIFCSTQMDGYTILKLWVPSNQELKILYVYSNKTILTENEQLSYEQDLKVEGLCINYNERVKFLPIKIYKILPNLIGYQARNCLVKKISGQNFENLKKLKTICLSLNQISHIQSDTFEDVDKLEYLSLWGNRLKYIETLKMHNLKNLKFLYLDTNHITYIEENAFVNFTELKKISLAGNKLQYLSDRHFENNEKLEKIWLNDNNFKYLSHTMFDDMPNLDYVGLKNSGCINNFYHANKFDEMKKKIKQNCTMA